MQERIVDLLAKLPDGEFTEQLLLVNDDLNNLFLRLVFILFTIFFKYFKKFIYNWLLINLSYRYSRYEKNREAGCSSISTVDGPSINTTDLLQGFINEPIATTSNQFNKLSKYYINY